MARVVEQAQRHAPEDMALDIDSLDEQRFGEAQRCERECSAYGGAHQRADGGGEDAHNLALLRSPGRVGGHPPQERVDAPAGRMCLENVQVCEHVDQSGVEAHLLVRLAQSCGEQAHVSRLGLAAREPELATVEAAVVGPDDEHEPDLSILVAVDRHEHRGRAQRAIVQHS